MTKPIITTKVEQQNNVHTRLKVFNRGGLAGKLVVNTQDAAEIIRRLEDRPRVQNKDTMLYIGNMLLAEGYNRTSFYGIEYENDREVADKCVCKYCGGSCIYRGFKREDSYLAYAVCTECDAAFEF